MHHWIFDQLVFVRFGSQADINNERAGRPLSGVERT